ncbi:hypothetical protein FEM48_Zijuj06G0023000 [Ziziphus jujuba var. spinosa]|uniref:SWIRM domain-containing protein n=1 Tax=Ziziphus jujuba var. spinosa TaxID=714518 RepID=A0A978V6K9_ZIZJJ|nr:hypothetical protein FEM48_Zijuj06G0023000 [Ziziphus jujuba var. spinosa]
MEGDEKKSGAKKRSKPIEVGIDSDDNEPIGSLLKFRRPRNPKKVKSGIEGGGERGKKFEIEDDDFGGMDDTLASFRKKLKAPKKDTASGTMRGKGGSVLDMVESSDPSSTGPVDVDGGGLDAKSVPRGVENGDDGSDVTMDMGMQNKRKGKAKRPNVDSTSKSLDDGSESMGSGCSLLKDKNESDLQLGEGSSRTLNNHLEDSLSSLFHKAQSGSTRKSRVNSSLKEKGSQILEDDLSRCSEGVSGDFKPVAVRRPKMASAARVTCKNQKSEERFPVASALHPADSVSASEKCKTDNHSLDHSFCQASNCMEDNRETIRGPSLGYTISLEGIEPADGKDNTPSKVIPEDPAPVSSPSRSHTKVQDRDMGGPCDSIVLKGHVPDPCNSSKFFEEDGNQFNIAQDIDSCSIPRQIAALKTCNLKNGLKHSSTGDTRTLMHDVVEMPKSLSSGKRVEEIHEFGEDDESSSRYTYALPQQSKTEKVLKSHSELDSGQCSKDSHCSEHNVSHHSSDQLKMEETSSNCHGPNTCTEEPAAASGVWKKNVAVCDDWLSPNAIDSIEVDKSGYGFQLNNQEISLDPCIQQNSYAAANQKCNSIFSQNASSNEAYEAAYNPSHDDVSATEEADGTSSPCITPDDNGSNPEDVVSLPDIENKDNKLSIQRTMRKPKKRRHGDMAYEGDADWEILIDDQGFNNDRSSRARVKFDSSLSIVTEAESGGAAAISAGLKAHAAGPVEKIKFKEILKRRGGLQDYLECRNQILGLWSKDVSRILPLSDCGVTDTASTDEPSRASLIREIYAFLDQSGYINVGIATEKDKAEPGTKHNYKLLREKNFESSGASLADSEDGVSFIVGQVKSSKTSNEVNNGAMLDGEDLTHEAMKGSGSAAHIGLKLANATEQEKYLANCNGNGSIDTKFPNRTNNVNCVITDPSCETWGGGKTPKIDNESQSIQPIADDDVGKYHHLHSCSKVGKKIIVIGAGPAGLTAARHLQRQGFSVTVLEGRNRIGGRVYTDRSTLSVPVDLGASIITGVEADVATERRPDPSSLICAQMGLELTVLNSDCPLYDIVTSQKVPSDLDEALEAEYNSLLDDMLLLVAQRGEHAMKMSLEEGLEYALLRRRMVRSGMNLEEKKLHTTADGIFDSRVSTDGRVSEEHCSEEELLSPLERRVMDWHFANLEYGCAALLKEVSLPNWNQDDVYGGFGGAHCMIKGGYSTVVESLGEGLCIYLNHVVTDVSYDTKVSGVLDGQHNQVKVSTSNGSDFFGDAVLITVPLGCLKAETIKFSPPLPHWKHSAIQRLGFGVLNKVILEFPDVFWDDSVDYFGTTAEETNWRGKCFMFWNVRKTVGAPVLIALVVGKAAIDGQSISSSDHVRHALMVLRKLFGEAKVPEPVGSVVTDWGRDPFSYGAYSYVAVGASGEDYDILGRPVENCLFFAGEATCKEHPDTVGGAMMSGLREAVRIIDIFNTGNDYTAEVEAMEALQRQSDSEMDEVRDITKRLDAVELSNVLYKNSLDGTQILTREGLLRDMFFNAKTTAGRLHLVKELLRLPRETLKSFAGTREGLTTLNSWILDSMGKDGTQLLRHCVRLLVLVSTDLLSVRLSGIGKTVKEKVCVHTSRDIRAIASQLVSVWLEVFRKEKASSGGLKFSRQLNVVDSSKRKSVKDSASGKPPLHTNHGSLSNKESCEVSAATISHLPSNANFKKVNGKIVRLETANISRSEINSSRSQGSTVRMGTKVDDDIVMTEEEKAAIAAAEAARAAALAAAEAYASSEAKNNALLQLPKIPSFHKFARREQYAQVDEYDVRRKWSGGVLGRQDCISEIDSRNCRVRNWSVDFSATCVNFDNSRISADNLSQRSHSNEIASHLNLREHSGESVAVDSSIYTKAWVDTAGSVGIKDYHAIERWQSQAAAADSDFYHPAVHIKDEEDSNTTSKVPTWKHDGLANESSVSQVTMKRESLKDHHRGADRIKQAVVDYVASLLMPLYKAKKIDKDGYKSIMKKSATKVMEQATDAEKSMAVSEFLDFKRRNKIRSFVDKLIERHMSAKPVVKS